MYTWEGVDFPLTVGGIETFEKKNKNVGVIAYTTLDDSKKPTCIWITKKSNVKMAVIFLVNGHWCWIKNENAFLNLEGVQRGGVLTCRRCFYKAVGDGKYSAEDRLSNHLRFCENHDFCRETVPSEGNNVLEFKMWKAIVEHPICISSDFECLLERRKLSKKNTKQFQKHVPISCGIGVDRFDGKNFYTDFCGLESPRIFVEKLEEIAIDWYKEFKKPKKMEDVEKANRELEITAICDNYAWL